MAWCSLLPHDPGPYPQGAQTPTQVVCHRTYGSWAGDYGVGKGSRKGIGFHFLVGKQQGQWVQFYDTAQRCNHAAGGNRDSIGIEVTGTDTDVMTGWQVEALGQLVQWLADTHGIPATKYHGPRTSFFAGYRDHADVAGSTHTDYWSDADWARIVAHAGEADDMGWMDDRQVVIDAIGRIDQRVANLEASTYAADQRRATRVATSGKWVSYSYGGGQHYVRITSAGIFIDDLWDGTTWAQQWGVPNCKPGGDVSVKVGDDWVIEVTGERPDGTLARVVYAPDTTGRWAWRQPEPVGV